MAKPQRSSELLHKDIGQLLKHTYQSTLVHEYAKTRPFLKLLTWSYLYTNHPRRPLVLRPAFRMGKEIVVAWTSYNHSNDNATYTSIAATPTNLPFRSSTRRTRSVTATSNALDIFVVPETIYGSMETLLREKRVLTWLRPCLTLCELLYQTTSASHSTLAASAYRDQPLSNAQHQLDLQKIRKIIWMTCHLSLRKKFKEPQCLISYESHHATKIG
eukprot:977353-Amphidinium_carterae.1